MLRSNPVRIPSEFPKKKDEIADCGPMSLQDAGDCHGHEMHPQKFVRLVGCHESSLGSHEDEHRLH